MQDSELEGCRPVLPGRGGGGGNQEVRVQGKQGQVVVAV